MKTIVELPGPAVVNRAVHTMAVIVIILFAFHFARLSGFSGTATSIAVLVSLLAAGSFALRRTISVDREAGHITRTITAFSVPLYARHLALPGMAWCGLRSDLPDVVVEVGLADGHAVEVLRFRNAYGRNEADAAQACSRLADALQIEDRGYGAQPAPAHLG